MRETVSRGDLVRARWPSPGERREHCYLGSGRWGASFDAWGLTNSGYRTPLESGATGTHFSHADHWHRGAHGLDYWIPLARIAWADEPPPAPAEYRQSLSLFDGRLSTRLAWPGREMSFDAAFDPERRDVFGIDITWTASGGAGIPSLVVSPVTACVSGYRTSVEGRADDAGSALSSGWWRSRVSVAGTSTILALRLVMVTGRAALASRGDEVVVTFHGDSGRLLLVLGAASSARETELDEEMREAASPRDFMAHSASAWHRRWGDSFVDVHDQRFHALWLRSLFSAFSSYGPDVRSPAPPMGWSGGGWRFGFPQDISYVHPAFLRLGHLDIARAIVEGYRAHVDSMRRFTRRTWGVNGTMWAWEFPIGTDSDLLMDGAPNWYQYEIHNAAYPARMAWETARYLADRDWAREVAWPIVEGPATFLANLLEREPDRTWGLHVTPSMGQDEMGGENADNYLCALTSARYALTAAVAMSERFAIRARGRAKWERMLRDGLAFARLHDETTGVLASCEGVVGESQVGRQKHPVQLNSLTFLPVGNEPDDATVRAYEMRDALCAGIPENHSYGWTLPAFWLAASHMRRPSDVERELDRAESFCLVDPEWMQIRESSGGMPHYVTSAGLYLQAVNDALVSDYWGKTEIGAACPESWRDVRFMRLRTADGRVHSGSRSGTSWDVLSER